MEAATPVLGEAIETLWCVVGSRIGPECLAVVLEASPQCKFIISPTERADKELVQRVLNRSSVANFRVLTFEETVSDVSSETTHVDWLLNLWGERIVPPAILSRIGDSVNIHPSFLPYGRGSDPIPWAIMENERAGASLHRMTPELDGGSIWCQCTVEYDFPESGRSLYERVLRQCVQLLRENWPLIMTGQIVPQDQAVTNQPARKRAQLLAAQRLNEEQLLELSAMDLVRRALALDFGDDFHLLVDLGGKEVSFRISVPSGHPEKTL